MKQTFQNGVLLLVFILAPLACQQDQAVRQPEHYLEASALLEKWHQLLLELERFTPGYRPPVTARMWSYVEMAAWQAALPGIPEATDLSVFVNGLPEAQRYSGQYFLPAGLNAAYAEIFRQFFPTAPSHLAEKINMLEEECLRGGGKKVHSAVLSRSVAYGKKIARDIWVWSTTDTIGHEGDQHNYDAQYRSPDGAGCWRPDGVHHTAALLPYWGMSRSMVVRPSDIGILPPLRYDTRPGTPFHVQAMEVLAMSKPLTNEYRWLAEFWSDDVPGLTVSPMGHWISVVNQAVERAALPLPKCLELYLKAALASADVMVVCWKAKYDFNLERPEAYLRRVANPGWKPLHDSPPFPSYPSGHAAIGSAVSGILTDFLGGSFPLTDRTHEGRTEFVGKPRFYRSFEEMAAENALSRIALGVHFRMDCDEGMRIGRLVSQRVAELPLQKQEARISYRQ